MHTTALAVSLKAIMEQETSGDQALSDTVTAPSVVAIMVTHNPGPWFEESLAALAAQDYPNLALLILDAASAIDPLPRIARVVPSAYVRRLSRNPGFAAACNRATRIVHGASHLVFCHDDVAPAPDAIRKMMERAFKSNAGIVTPKMVDWDDPTKLLALGGTVEQTGAYVPTVDPGDRDQGQYDRSEDVFVAPGGFMLTRADLFLTLGGFDGAMTFTGEDLDYSWRAQIAGARIVTEPSVRVRHVEAGTNDARLLGSAIGAPEDEHEHDVPTPVLDSLLLRRRHRLRMVLKVRGKWEAVVAFWKLFFLSIAEAVGGIVTGHGEHTAAVTSAWIWNAAHWRDLYKLRRHAQRARVVSDKTIVPRLGSSKARLARITREEYERRRSQLLSESSGTAFVGRLRKFPIVAWGLVLVIWIVGSRHLLTRDLPALGTIVPVTGSTVESFQRFLGMLPADPFGQVVTQSPIHLVFGFLSMLFLGSADVMGKVMVLGALPLGVWGMARLTRPLRSSQGRLAAILAYVAVPIPYDALAIGRWSSLVCYALAPFVLARMLRALDAPPFRRARRHFDVESIRHAQRDDVDDLEALDVSSGARNTADALREIGAETPAPPSMTLSGAQTVHVQATRDAVVRAERVLPMALLFGFAGMIVPQLLVAVVLVAFVLAVGGRLTKDADADGRRVVILTFVGVALAVLLLLPMFLGTEGGLRLLIDAPPLSKAPATIAEVLGFSIGVQQASIWTVGILVAGLPGVVFGRKWRYHLSTRLWLVTMTSMAVQLLGAHVDWFNPNPSVFLTMAAVAGAMNVAVGVASVHEDLPSFRFGWRQALPVLASVGVLCALIPVVTRIGNGTWKMPDVSSAQIMSWMEQDTSHGAFRVMWLGRGDALLGNGRRVDVDLAAAISQNQSLPENPALPTRTGEVHDGLAAALVQTRRGETVSLGHLLAPYGIRYIAIPNRTAAEGLSAISLDPPADVAASLEQQLDLRRVPSDASITIFENTQFVPVISQLTPEGVLAARSKSDALATANLDGARPILTRTSRITWEGIATPGEVFTGLSRSSAWSMSQDGRRLQSTPAFGWASSYAVPKAGNVQLKYTNPDWLLIVQVINAVAWLFVLLVALRHFSTNGRWS